VAELHYFSFYAKDWLTGTAAMSAEAKGAFVDLLAHAWLAQPSCVLPSDDATLARLSGLGRRWKANAAAIRAQFVVVDGGLRNAKLYAVYLESVEKHENRVRAGAAGGRARAERHRDSSNAESNASSNRTTELEPGSSNQSQSHRQNQGTTPPPPLRARETSEAYRTVCALLPAAYRADFDALLDVVPEGEAWCREVRGYLEGMGRQAVTPEQVGVGVRHYVAAGKAADAKPRQLWRYVTGAKDDEPPPRANGNGRKKGPGEQGYENAMAAFGRAAGEEK
jgi:uncharacterized protein YdaU (DUF1376 family)